MKYICTLILSMASLIAAEPPRLLSLSVSNNIAYVSWTHPTAQRVEIIYASPTLGNATWNRIIRPTPGRTNWQFRVDPRSDFECAVRAVSATTDRSTAWSHTMGYKGRPQETMPPDPLDQRRWSQSAANTLGTTTSTVGEKDLVMTWSFNKSIEPGFDFQVYESQNLKDWRIVARIPLSTNAGFNIPKAPFGFYKVAVVHQLSGTVHWNAITNLFMDP